MWIPTHVKVTVHKARNLQIKGRSGVNDPYVVLHLDDTKCTTSVKTRNTTPEWNENYDMPIPTDLRHSVVRLSVHHRNLFSMDDFLGQTSIDLQQFPIYDRPQSRWYSLGGRRQSRRRSVEDDDGEDIGEVQLTLTFMVQSKSTPSDQTEAPSSSSRFERQRSLSFKSLASRVGMKLTDRWRSQSDLRDSPLTDLTERKVPVHSALELDTISRSFHHLHLSPADDNDETFAPNGHSRPMSESDVELFTPGRYKKGDGHHISRDRAPDDRAPNNDQEKVEISSPEGNSAVHQGVDLSTATYAEILRRRPMRQRSLHTLPEESQEPKNNETMERLNNARNVDHSPPSPSLCGGGGGGGGKPFGTPVYTNSYIRAANKRHSFVGCGETPPMVAAYRLNEMDEFMTNEKQRMSEPGTTDQPPSSRQNIPQDKNDFEGYDRDELIKLVLEQESWIHQKRTYVQDLEDYIDGLLIRVLDANTQAILENPYNKTGKRASQQSRKADNDNDNSQKNALDVKSKKKSLIDIFKLW